MGNKKITLKDLKTIGSHPEKSNERMLIGIGQISMKSWQKNYLPVYTPVTENGNENNGFKIYKTG